MPHIQTQGHSQGRAVHIVSWWVTARGGCSQACLVEVGGQKELGTDWIKSILKMQDEYHASTAWS